MAGFRALRCGGPVDENTPREQVPPMLQALLAERFKLALHHEQKEMAGYALAVAKGGFKLKPVDESRTFEIGGYPGN